jgi:hypothetical protein
VVAGPFRRTLPDSAGGQLDLTRWRAVAQLHFLGKIHTQAKSDLLGGADELIGETAKTLEKLDMLNPRR